MSRCRSDFYSYAKPSRVFRSHQRPFHLPPGKNYPLNLSTMIASRAMIPNNAIMPACIVTIDIGNPEDIHPRDKQDVGARLSRWALAHVYGQNIEYSGPLFRTAARDSNGVRVWFDHAAGLTARGGSPTGFEIAGADRKFLPAEARIDGTSVVVSSAQVDRPQYVRYGWSDNPSCNLYNSDGLPASPFRSGD